MEKHFVQSSVSKGSLCGALLAATLCLMPLNTTESHAAQRAHIAAADQNGGYSNAVLDRVIEKWQAPKENIGRVVRIMVMVDGDGKLTDCMPITESGSPAADKAACDAARAVGTFATPPYGLPMDVFLSFWMGTPNMTPSMTSNTAGNTAGTTPQTETADLSIDLSPQDTPTTTQAPMPLVTTIQTPTQDAPITEPVVIPSSPTRPVLERAPIPYTTALHATNSELSPEANTNAPHTSYKPTIQDSRSGAVFDEKDYYVKRVMGKIGPLVVFPANMPRGKFSTSISVRVDDDGTILKVILDDSSGIAALDAAIVAAAKEVGKVYAPPSNKIEDLYLTFVVDNP